jgi:drug/metabolite transporter (DMT)-like permease
MIDWVSLAIMAAVAIALVNILDSHLITKRMPGLRAFLIPVSIGFFTYSLITSLLFPLPEGIEARPVLVAVGSGVLRAASILILLYTLKTEEVSRAVPIFHTFPVFVAILAVPLLGETLGYLQWLAIIVIVSGSVIVSAKRGEGGITTWLGKPFFLLFIASLLIAVANIASKYALDYMSFWNVYWISTFCMSSIYLLFSLRPTVIRQLINMPGRNPALALIALNETLAMTGMLLAFWAMETGPVSLVSTITGSRPIIVFFLALVINRFLPKSLITEPAGRGSMVVRLIATLMIAGGIAIIYLA